MKYEKFESAAYRKGRRIAASQGLDLSLLDDVVQRLADGERLPPEYKDHPLKGNRKGQRECRVDGKLKGDWLLIYKKFEDALLLYLIETGTHRDLRLGG